MGELGKPGRLRVRGIGLKASGDAVSARVQTQTQSP